MNYHSLTQDIQVSEGAHDQRTLDLFDERFLRLLTTLHRKLEMRRTQLLAVRLRHQISYDQGGMPRTEIINSDSHKSDWKVATIPEDLKLRRVEITGPVNDTKMVINMLSRNSDGARADMAMLDFEDSMYPSWDNVIDGFYNVIGASKGKLSFQKNPKDPTSKIYKLNPEDMAGLMIRVRGLHLVESNIKIDGQAVSAGLFDLAICFYHTASSLVKAGKTPKYYVPKIEYPMEACWWNDLFTTVQEELGFSRGTLRATFLIETLPAAFNMEEILFELREHAVGMNVGRWDKIFSDIKTLKNHPLRISPNRGDINMKKFWMENYAKKLVNVCHRRGAFAIGGMSAFTPGKDEEVRELQTKRVMGDKSHEFKLGHDGCWVSHPYFIAPAMSCFPKNNQVDFIDTAFPEHPDLVMEGSGPRTLSGLRTNIQVAIAYLVGMSKGLGCVSYNNMMEDLATLEISRAQVWQWKNYSVQLDDWEVVTDQLITEIFLQEQQKFSLEILENYSLSENEQAEEIKLIQKATQEGIILFTALKLEPFLTTTSPIKYSPTNTFEGEEQWKSQHKWKHFGKKTADGMESDATTPLLKF